MTYKLLISAAAIIIIFLNACHNEEDNNADMALAEKHCGSCHLFPKPDMLDKSNWEKVLPKMALFMGVKSALIKQTSIDAIERTNIPDKPMVSDEDWAKIKNYYIAKAPYRLSFPLSSITSFQKDLFVGKSLMPFSNRMPNVTSVKIDTAKQVAYAADEINQEIWVLGKDGTPVNRFIGHMAISDIQIQGDKLLLTYMGNSIDPSVRPHGYVKKTNLVNNEKTEVPVGNLYRPTQTLSVNLDNTPDEELVVNEFGVYNGILAVWKKDGDTYAKYVIESSPGAIKTIPVDYDKDGLIDLITLYGQGDERIVWYKNRDNLQFTPTTLLRFPPVYGSSSFELVDFNKDGLLDILYTAGDNSDYSQELKPYHGVYMFVNQGKTTFKEAFFYQMNGAYKAVARDFDLDGDLDIAAIAFFVDYFEKTPKDFVFFENAGKGFNAKTLNIKNFGRWMVMDTGDIDNDGDEDIILGNHPVGATPGTLLKEWIKSKATLLLVNQSANKKK